MAGIPTLCVTRSGFAEVLANAYAAFGFPAEAPMGYVWPTEMFLAESDLSPIAEHFDAFISGLTDWEPETTELGTSEVGMIDVEGDDYAEVYEKVNNLFLRNLWRDSLQIVPPTEELVDWILTGTDMDPDEVVSHDGGVAPRGGIATVRAVAICLAMAGGRPEYLPFLIASVKAMTDPESKMQSWTTTTNSTIPVVVVNGPVAQQIRLSSGYGLLGPDPLRPAGEILGRSVRIIQQTLGGAIPGSSTMAIFGGMRSTNAFFAEENGNVPEGWTTWAEDRGFTRDQNVVTVTVINSMVNQLWTFGDEHYNNCSLYAMADIMAIPNRSRYSQPAQYQVDNKDLNTGIVMLPSGFVQSLVDVNGYTKEDVKNILWENSKVPFEKVEKWDYVKSVTQHELHKDAKEGDLIPVCPVAEQLTVIIAGGSQSGHGYFMGPVTQGKVVSCEVELPSNWDDLLFEAEIDLGPLPSAL